MAILFWIFLDQIRPNLIKLNQIGFLSKKCYYEQELKKDKNSRFLFHFFVSDFKIGCGWVEALLCGCVL